MTRDPRTPPPPSFHARKDIAVIRKKRRVPASQREFTVLDLSFPGAPVYPFPRTAKAEDLRWIYALVDPRDNTVRYVGMSRSPNERLKNHVGDPVNYKSRPWIDELAAAGLIPRMVVLSCVHWMRWEVADRRWISYYRRLGKLYNIQPGGKLPPKVWLRMKLRPRKRAARKRAA